jgi:hypothetical protein
MPHWAGLTYRPVSADAYGSAGYDGQCLLGSIAASSDDLLNLPTSPWWDKHAVLDTADIGDDA